MTEAELFKNDVFVVLQKPGRLFDIYNITSIILVLEERWNDKDMGLKVSVDLSMAGNDFLPKLHGISHTKTVDMFLHHEMFRTSLIECAISDNNKLMLNINKDLYCKFIKYLYCPKKLNPNHFSFEEIRQLSIMPLSAKTLQDFRNPQMWLLPKSALMKMARNIKCLIDYYMTAGDHFQPMPNFLQHGSLSKNKDGEIEYDLGPDSHIKCIEECLLTDVDELASKVKYRQKRKPDETPQKGQR
ncbi:hypothetical protein ACF0H5_003142 [Mactra antiquata]